MEFIKFNIFFSWSYFFLFVSIGLVVSFLCKLATERNKKIYFFFAYFILVFFASCRSVYVGKDTIEYVEFFSMIYNYGLDYALGYRFEPLFVIYSYVVGLISHEYWCLFLFNALITNFALLFFIHANWKKGDSFMFLPLFIINYQYDMSAMRSSLAVAMILFSFVYADRHKYIYSLFFSILSVLFHYTAVFSIFIVAVHYLTVKNRKLLNIKLIVAIVIIGAIAINGSLAVISSYVIESQYSGYIKEFGSGWFGYWYLVLCALFSVMVISKKIKNKEDVSICEIANLIVIVALPVYVVLNAYRIPKYFLMSRCVTYKKIYTAIKTKEKLIVQPIAFIILILLLIFFFSRINNGLVYELNPKIFN